MLRKVMKHEIKATYRLFLIISATLLAVSGLLALFENLVNSSTMTAPYWVSIFDGIVTILFVFSIMAVVMAGIFYPGLRFQKSMYGDEGYLTNTLPVSARTLIFGKAVIHAFWMVISLAVIFLAACIVSGLGPSEISVAYDMLKLLAELTTYPPQATVLIFLIVVAVVFANIGMMYLSLAIGNMFSSHKMLGSVIIYIVLSNVTQISSLLGIFRLSVVESEQMYVEETGTFSYNISKMMSELTPKLAVTLLIVLAAAALFFGITEWISRRKLNLA